VDNSLKNLIDSASSILILLPTKAYLDQVAAGLSLYLTLKSSKDVAVSSPSQMTVEFSRLIGVDKISTELGNKNIERVSYDIEEGQFKLSVIPKAGMTVPTSEQTNISYAGVKADLIILVGGANESHFPAISTPDLKGVKIIHIGTRLLEVSSDAQIMSFARPGSSSSELVGNLIKENDLSIDADIATNLLAGIEDGSKNFQSPDVTADTFSMFAQLLNMGGQRIKKMTASSFPQGAIPTQPYNQQPKQVPQSQKLVEQILQGQEQPDKEPQPEEVPTSWSEPKIYTGTSVS